MRLNPGDDIPGRMNALNGLWDSNPDRADKQGVFPALRTAALGLAKGDVSWLYQAALIAELSKASIGLTIEQSQGQPELIATLGQGHEQPELAALLLDLTAAAALDSFQIRRCFADGAWFSPGLRSARSKFCSARCRNRFNYELRSGATFLCSLCVAVHEISDFSGLAQFGTELAPAQLHSARPICVHCISRLHPDWTPYMVTAEIAPIHETPRTSRDEYVRTINKLLKEALTHSEAPLHYSKIANYVRKHCEVRGRSPDLTILGYLLRNTEDFTQVSRHVFTLTSRRSSHQKALHAKRESE